MECKKLKLARVEGLIGLEDMGYYYLDGTYYVPDGAGYPIQYGEVYPIKYCPFCGKELEAKPSSE